MTLTRGQRLYDRWSDHPLLFRGGYELAFRGRYRHLRRTAYDELGLAPGGAVLDLACGWGTNLRPLSDRVGPTGAVVGLDFSEGMVRAAKRTAADLPPTRDVRIARGDAHRLPFADGAFDAVHCALALTATSDPAAVVAEARRVVGPTGRFVVFDTRPFQSGPLTALNPVVVRLSRLATDWNPDADVLGALRESFRTVSVESFLDGTAYVATARG